MPVKRTALVLSFKLNTWETVVLGAILAALAAVQQQISMSAQAHAAIAMALLLIGAMAHPLTGSQILAKVPVQLVAIIDAALGAVLIFTQTFDIGNGGRTVVAVVVVIASTWGFGPTPAAPSPAPPKQHRR